LPIPPWCWRVELRVPSGTRNIFACGCGVRNLCPLTARLVRVPTVVPGHLHAVVWYVLRDFRQEVEGVEHFSSKGGSASGGKVPVDAAHQSLVPEHRERLAFGVVLALHFVPFLTFRYAAVRPSPFGRLSTENPECRHARVSNAVSTPESNRSAPSRSRLGSISGRVARCLGVGVSIRAARVSKRSRTGQAACADDRTRYC